MTRDDREASLAFFRSLPEEDRAYLRRDVIRTDVIEERIREMELGRVRRLVAVADERIVADGALELSGAGWDEHVAEVRLIVARPFQRRGLGILMARELYALAAKSRVEQIVVRFMRPQAAARSIFEKLGFQEEALLPGHVKDRAGAKQDLVLMRCDLEALWRKLEDFVVNSDWRRAR